MTEKFEPAEVFHVAEFICDELEARGWKSADLASRMNTGRGIVRDMIIIDLLLCVHKDGLLFDDETCKGLARAFGTSSEMWRSLDESWRAWPDRRSIFNAPEHLLSSAEFVTFSPSAT